jgi:hypothetical protein
VPPLGLEPRTFGVKDAHLQDNSHKYWRFNARLWLSGKSAGSSWRPGRWNSWGVTKRTARGGRSSLLGSGEGVLVAVELEEIVGGGD